jgi:hypothetical protein
MWDSGELSVSGSSAKTGTLERFAHPDRRRSTLRVANFMYLLTMRRTYRRQEGRWSARRIYNHR